MKQFCGSESVGSVCFWASRIRILPSVGKKVRKTLIYNIFGLLLDFLSLKTDVNVPSKCKRQKKLFLVGIFSFTDENSRIRIRIRKSLVRIPGPDQGEGTQPPSLLSPPGPGSVRLCNSMETKLPHSPSLPHPAS
jgi:hypothetical protein